MADEVVTLEVCELFLAAFTSCRCPYGLTCGAIEKQQAVRPGALFAPVPARTATVEKFDGDK